MKEGRELLKQCQDLIKGTDYWELCYPEKTEDYKWIKKYWETWEKCLQEQYNKI